MVELRNRIARIALGALALGVFVSCASKQPEAEFAGDRVVGGLDIAAAHLDSSWLAQHPDSSGWRVRWNLPSSTDGIVRILVFDDSLTPAEVSRLANGSGDPGLPDHPSVLARLGPADTSWSIPSKIFGGAQGKALPPTRHYRFSVWVQYSSGPTGAVSWWSLYLGDDIPPTPPMMLDSVGRTSVVLDFPRPKDQTNLFDTTRAGRLTLVRVLWWPGRTTADSAGKVASDSVAPSRLADRSIGAFRLVLSPLRYYTTYCYSLVLRDSAGNLAHSDVYQVTTKDSLDPAPPADLRSAAVRTDSVTFSWSPATDTSDGSGAPLRGSFPNHRIARYVVRLGGAGVDSTNLDPADPSFYSRNLASSSSGSRFAWANGRWSWYWRDFRPGSSGTVQVLAYDVSGNASAVSEVSYSVPLDSSRLPSCDQGWVPVSGTGAGLSSFCIEEREHADKGRPVTRVTWSQAIQACKDIGAELCSEAQWVRSCETFPDSASGTIPYGAVGAGEFGIDTTDWLKTNCQLGTGDSVAMVDPARSDSRCVSGWGVRDLPGRVGEWTRDVYLSGTPPAGSLQSGNQAYIGPSDITGQADLGTLHGGSALVLDQVDRTLSTARCRTRNYPASGIIDTLRSGTGVFQGVRQRPLPSGTSSAWGFRCCKVASP